MDTLIGDSLGAILVGLVVAVIVFLILREVFCWYWEINQGITLLKEIRDLLARRDTPDAANNS